MVFIWTKKYINDDKILLTSELNYDDERRKYWNDEENVIDEYNDLKYSKFKLKDNNIQYWINKEDSEFNEIDNLKEFNKKSDELKKNNINLGNYNIFDIYNFEVNNLDFDIQEQEGLNNTIFYKNNDSKNSISEFNHNTPYMKIVNIKENKSGQQEMFLSFDNDEKNNKEILNLYLSIKKFEDTIKNNITTSCKFYSNIMSEYKFENNEGNEIIIPERFKLKVQKYFDENNLEKQDFQKGSMVKCNITCNKLWFIDNNIFGIWWSVNSIEKYKS